MENSAIYHEDQQLAPFLAGLFLFLYMGLKGGGTP